MNYKTLIAKELKRFFSKQHIVQFTVLFAAYTDAANIKIYFGTVIGFLAGWESQQITVPADA